MMMMMMIDATNPSEPREGEGGWETMPAAERNCGAFFTVCTRREQGEGGRWSVIYKMGGVIESAMIVTAMGLVCV